jgi:hypothetical protein
MSLVWDDESLNATDKIVMLSLADHADDEGFCYPSIARLERRTGLAKRTVQNAIQRLKTSGKLAVDLNAGRGHANLYRVTPAPASYAPPQQVHPAADAPLPMHLTTHTPAADAPKPSVTIKEPSEERKTRDALLTVLSTTVADAYIAHRKSKRAKMTVHAAELVASSLADHPDPDTVVNESIKNGWTGVFPNKASPTQSKTTPGGQNEQTTSKSQRRMDAFIAGARGAGVSS